MAACIGTCDMMLRLHNGEDYENVPRIPPPGCNWGGLQCDRSLSVAIRVTPRPLRHYSIRKLCRGPDRQMQTASMKETTAAHSLWWQTSAEALMRCTARSGPCKVCRRTMPGLCATVDPNAHSQSVNQSHHHIRCRKNMCHVDVSLYSSKACHQLART